MKRSSSRAGSLTTRVDGLKKTLARTNWLLICVLPPAGSPYADVGRKHRRLAEKSKRGRWSGRISMARRCGSRGEFARSATQGVSS